MRTLLLVVVVAACTPTITPGTYLCGPEQLCPENQACNGPDNVCVREGTEQPFACGDMAVDPTNDDTPATGTTGAALGCVSSVIVHDGCLKADDPADFVQIDVPAECTAVGITATVAYPIAFQPVTFQLAKGDEPAQTMETACPASTKYVDGEDVRCLDVVLEPGGHYALGVVHDTASNADCGGACANNRYQLRYQLETP